MDCSSESLAVRTCESADGVQCPNDKNPILFNCTFVSPWEPFLLDARFR